MDVWTKVLTPADPSQPFKITWHELGWHPEQIGNHQISANGLGGGTYTVKIRTPGDPTYQTHQPDATEDDTVIIDKPLAAAFEVTFANLGVGASPVVTVSGWPRRQG